MTDGAEVRARALAAAGRPADAAVAFVEAFQAEPGRPALAVEAALALAAAGQRAQAAALLELALGLHPRDAGLLTTRGNLLKGLGRLDEALACQEAALAAAPASPEVHANLTALHLARGQPAAALASAEAALALAPGAVELAFNRGTCLLRLERAAEAAAALEAVVARAPAHAGAWLNLGEARLLGGDAPGAEAAFRAAVAAAPGDAAAHWNLALRLLARGAWEEGWREYEWRKRLEGLPLRRLPGPFWDGRPLPGQALVVTAEQGLGDTLQFLRYLPAARARAQGPLVLEVPPALGPLLAGGVPGADALVPQGQPLPPHAAHSPLLSLPGLLAAPVAPAAPWLAAEPARVAAWRARLPPGGTLVAIAWQGNPAYRADAARSVPLRHFEALARVPGVRLVAVQRRHGLEQLAAWPPGLPLEVPAGLDEDGAFLDTAAVLTAADLLVASDSAVVHLAGALGRPAWVLLPQQADWRWGPSGEATPWYGQARLFRQPRPGDWAGALAAVAGALAVRAGGR